MDIKEIEKKLVKAKSGNYKICAWGAGYVGRNHGYDLIQKKAAEFSVAFFCINRSIFPTMRVPADTTSRIRFLWWLPALLLFARTGCSRDCKQCRITDGSLQSYCMEYRGSGQHRDLPCQAVCSSR